jgi:hypothetical protein
VNSEQHGIGVPHRFRRYSHAPVAPGRVTKEVVQGWFEQALVDEANEILMFLFNVISVIEEIAWNGEKPDLSNSAQYDLYVRGVTRDVEGFVRGLIRA